MNKKSPPKNIFWKFIIIYFILFFTTVLLIPFVSLMIIGLENISKYTIYISTFSQVFIIGGTGILIMKKYSDNDKSTNFAGTFTCTFNNKVFKFIKLLSLAVFLFFISRLIIDGINWIYIGITDDFSHIIFASGMLLPEFLIAVIFLAIIPAFCEEFFYRVVIYHMLNIYKPYIIILSSVSCFSLSHIMAGVDAMIGSFLLGIILILIYMKSRNFYYVVFVHFSYNVLELFFTHKYYWPTDGIYISSRASSGTECVFWGMLYIAIAIGIISVAFFILEINIKKTVKVKRVN